MMKRSSFGRSGSVASASEHSDGAFEVSAGATSKIAAILFTFTAGDSGQNMGVESRVTLENLFLLAFRILGIRHAVMMCGISSIRVQQSLIPRVST